VRHALATLFVLAAVPAAAAPLPPPSGVTFTAALGGGAEVGSHSSSALGELELGVGFETGIARPELALVLGLSPGTYAGVRPGVHVPLAGLPFYARGALDLSHAGGDWSVRWLLAGAGTELTFTSVLGAFAELDLGVPLARGAGVGFLGRAGFAIRF
jgi:hypothetical protein